MSYATLSEFRTQIDKSGTSGPGSDAALQMLLDAAAEVINAVCNRPTGFLAVSTATGRYYVGDGKAVLYIDECVAVTAVAVKSSPTDTTYTTWASPTTNMAGDGDWLAFSGDPMNPNFDPVFLLKPYTGLMIDPNGDHSFFTSGRFTGGGGFRPSSLDRRGVPTVKVTAKWGYAVYAPRRVVTANILQAARWYKRGEAAWSDTLASADTGLLLFRQSLDPDIKTMLIEARLVKPVVG